MMGQNLERNCLLLTFTLINKRDGLGDLHKSQAQHFFESLVFCFKICVGWTFLCYAKMSLHSGQSVSMLF